MKPTCEGMMHDPERWTEHLESCAECRQMEQDLDRLDAGIRAVALPATDRLGQSLPARLPIAPWEGATHRPWALVMLAAAGLAVVITVLFLFAGISPIHGFFGSILGELPKMPLLEAARALANILGEAPRGFHLAVGACFVVVNAILVFLLRRSPRGYDA